MSVPGYSEGLVSEKSSGSSPCFFDEIQEMEEVDESPKVSLEISSRLLENMEEEGKTLIEGIHGHRHSLDKSNNDTLVANEDIGDNDDENGNSTLEESMTQHNTSGPEEKKFDEDLQSGSSELESDDEVEVINLSSGSEEWMNENEEDEHLSPPPVSLSLNQNLFFELFSVGNEQFDEILSTFHEIFECFTNSKATTVNEIWENYIANQIEPTGWIGTFRAGMNSTKRVLVKDVSVERKEAFVEILEAKEKDREGKLKLTRWIPLEKIFLCEEENEHNLNLEQTKHLLDMYRAFRSMFQMPWDTEFAHTWYQKVLLQRSQLLADMVFGNIPISQIRRILRIIQSSREISAKIKILDHEDDDDSSASIFVNTETNRVRIEQEYCELNMKLADLQAEFEKLEKKEIRQCMDYMKSSNTLKFKSNIVLVVPDGNVAMPVMDKFLKILNNEYNASSFKVVHDLPTALNGCLAHSYIYLFPGKYKASGLCELESGGSIFGLGDSSSEVKIIPDAAGDVWFFVNGILDQTVLIENLTLEVKPPNTEDLLGFESIGFLVKEVWGPPLCAFHVQNGSLCLKNVKLVGPDPVCSLESDDIGFTYKTHSIQAKIPKNVILVDVSIEGFARNDVTEYDPC